MTSPLERLGYWGAFGSIAVAAGYRFLGKNFDLFSLQGIRKVVGQVGTASVPPHSGNVFASMDGGYTFLGPNGPVLSPDEWVQLFIAALLIVSILAIALSRAINSK